MVLVGGALVHSPLATAGGAALAAALPRAGVSPKRAALAGLVAQPVLSAAVDRGSPRRVTPMVAGLMLVALRSRWAGRRG
jgi:hypothetical protein